MKIYTDRGHHIVSKLNSEAKRIQRRSQTHTHTQTTQKRTRRLLLLHIPLLPAGNGPVIIHP